MQPGGADRSSGDSAGGVSIAPGVWVREGVLEFSTSRASGPGGQNVNKVESRVQLRVRVDELPIAGYARRQLRRLEGANVVGTERVLDAEGREHEVGGELLIVCQEHRSQIQNKQECLARLRELVVRALAKPKVRKKTKPTRSSRERRLSEKKRRSEAKKSRGNME